MEEERGFELLKKYRSSLMGLAALWILFFHTWTPVLRIPALSFVECFFKRIGFCGVDIFFFLSGMGLVYSIQSHSTLGFYGQRLRRVAIPFLVVAVFWCAMERWSAGQLLRIVFAYDFYFVNIYKLLWFIPAIATLYLLFPIYYRLFSASSNKIVFTLCVLILWLAASILLRDRLRTDLYGFTNRIPVFCAGCLAGYLSQRRRYPFRRGTVDVLMLLTLALGVYLSYLTNYCDLPLLVPVPNCCVPNFLITISICYLFPRLLALLGRIPRMARVEQGIVRVLTFFGMFSLELYCVQEKTAEKLVPRLASHVPALIANIIMFAAMTAGGILLYWLHRTIWKGLDRVRQRSA